MVEGYFALGDEANLLQLARAAGIADARVLAREGWARYTSIDELLRIEIKGSPLAALVDEAAFERVRAAARAAHAASSATARAGSPCAWMHASWPRARADAGARPARSAHALPIRIPVTNTSTPPSTTWNAACRNGVSM